MLKIMKLKPFKSFTYSVVLQNRTSSLPWRKLRWSPLKTAFVQIPLFQKRRWSCDFPPVGCLNTPRDLIPRKYGILHPVSSCHGTSRPLPHSLYGRTGTYADDIIKISRINRLPDLFTNGAPRAPLSTAELILTIFLFFSVSYRGGRKGGPKTAKPHRKTQKKKLPWGPEAFLARFPVANTRFA